MSIFAKVGLTLLVYNVGQYWLRKRLEMEKTTLPNQLRKAVQNPTLRWIFQIMEGISIVRFYDKALLEVVREVISNINELRKKIIYLFGEAAARIYGLIPKTCAEGLEM